MKPLCIAILFILIPLCAFCADWDLGQNGNVDLYGFQSCGYDEHNRLAWQIAGRKASVRGPLTTIEGCELVFFHDQGKQNAQKPAIIKADQSGKVRISLKAAACDFNYAMGEIKSDQPIVIDLGDDVDISKLDKKTAKTLKTGSFK